MPNSLRLRYLLPCTLLWMLVILLGVSTEAQATHIRAGDITAKRDTTPNPNPRRFFFTMIIYTDDDSDVEDPQVIMNMGDGNSVTVPRLGTEIPIGNRVSKAVYKWEYTYGADSPPGGYKISWNGVNRNNNILNISPPSQDVSFLISTTIDINTLRVAQSGYNSTPVLTVAPIDNAAIGRKFVHNPGAFDADGDSLAFKLRVPMRVDASGQATQVPGYTLPNRTFSCNTSTGSGEAILTLDIADGQLVWDAPCRQGEYNVAFVVEEWRITIRDGKRFAEKLGEVVRDMQITVLENENRPPVLQPKDTCIVAGTNFSAIVRATDPDNHRVTITANGGFLPPAEFTQLTKDPGSSTGRLTWNTECLDVRESPYQVIFRAEDDSPNIGGTITRLADLQPWNIRVVGPAPENLRTTTNGQKITVEWDPYICQNASVMRIYRREGKSGFVPDGCETGVPGSTGYVLVGEVRRDANGQWPTSFTDETVEPGIEYCYIIYAQFPSPGRGESLASNEACAEVELEVPLLTNVSVNTTSTTTGQITVRWTQPRKLDDLTAPLQYVLARKVTGQPDASYTEVKRTSVLSDTVFIDNNLNTTDLAYRYRLQFFEAGNTLVDTTSATSVRLNVTPAEGDSKSFTLTWNYNVPWKNEVYRHRIFRKTGSGQFVLIDSVSATSTNGTYTDLGAFNGEGLTRGETYCYYVQTRGSYELPAVEEPLLNNSQEVCALLPKLVCPPELSIEQLNCETFNANPTDPPYQNVISWVPQITGDCTDEIAYYTIYFKASPDAEYQVLVAQWPADNETRYVHEGLDSFAGCYVVTATDVNGNESAQSNEVCNDNCISFELPNIITPNGDDKNEVFRPKRASFITSIKFTVFNRWGVKVYEGNDPAINWAGTDNDGNRLTDGTYYYEAQVEFNTFDPANKSRKYKGWVEIIR